MNVSNRGYITDLLVSARIIICWFFNTEIVWYTVTGAVLVSYRPVAAILGVGHWDISLTQSNSLKFMSFVTFLLLFSLWNTGYLCLFGASKQLQTKQFEEGNCITATKLALIWLIHKMFKVNQCCHASCPFSRWLAIYVFILTRSFPPQFYLPVHILTPLASPQAY